MGMQMFDFLVLIFEFVQHLELSCLRAEDLCIIADNIGFERLALFLSMIMHLPNVFPGLWDVQSIVFGFKERMFLGRLLEVAET